MQESAWTILPFPYDELAQPLPRLTSDATCLFEHQLPVFSAKYPPGHAPGKGLQSLVGAPLPGDVRGRSGH